MEAQGASGAVPIDLERMQKALDGPRVTMPHGLSHAEAMAFIRGAAAMARVSKKEPLVTWVDACGCTHTMSIARAAEELRALYDKWPMGLDEIEASVDGWRRAAQEVEKKLAEMHNGAPKHLHMTAEEARKLSALNADALVAYAMKMIREAVKECADWVTLQCGPWQRGQQLTPEHEKTVEVLRGLGYEVEVPHIYFPHSAVKISWSNAAAQSQGDKP